MRGPARRFVSAMIILLVLIMSGACTPQESPAVRPSADRYQPADPVGEDSEARPVPPGAATTLTAPLVGLGAFCAQIRSNAEGRAIWCRNVDADDPWVAQFLFDAEDRLAWGWIPMPGSRRSDPYRLSDLAGAAFGALWPGTADRISTEVVQFVRENEARLGRPKSGEGSFRHTWRDGHAAYSVAGRDGLIVAGRDAEVSRWPSDAGHYGSRMSVAVGDLQQSGFDCHYPGQTSCQRGNSAFQVSLRGDRIITADFMIFGNETLADTFPRGLTFLTPAVRPEVAARIEQSRKARTDFLGVVAGTLLAIDAAPVPPVGGTVPVEVRVGAPLTGTFPI
ncbi:hypothetical protein [Microlunatus speluncae]|uniref:hypothetical protein n=1 Tax=Microlunatus speluncae TaxID=2594267 RepID=UPI001266430F|nr:hypothetical protein [Microlunatus speluncae]